MEWKQASHSILITKIGLITGRDHLKTLEDLQNKLINQSKAICASQLTDWQKVDAINNFVISQSRYYLHAAKPCRTWAKNLDAAIHSLIKKGLRLPRRTITALLYTEKSKGGLGLFSVLDNWYTAILSQTFRCISSPDTVVQTIARTNSPRLPKPGVALDQIPPIDQQCNFLNSSIQQEERQRRDVSSLWSECRSALHQANLKINIYPSNATLRDRNRNYYSSSP